MNDSPRRSVMPIDEARAFFGVIYGGEHNIPAKKSLTPYGDGWKLQHYGELSTFDFDKLTALVLLAHDRCVRVSIMQGGPKRVSIVLHKRQPSGSMSERHPTIEEALVRWRNSNPARGAVSVHAPTIAAAATVPVEMPQRPWREVLDLGGDTVTSATVERAFARLADGWREDSPFYLELAAARASAKHELCFEHDQSNWGN